MTRLPVVSGKETVRALEKIGYVFDHQRGSHIVLRKNTSPFRRVTIPDHREIARGTLRSIIREVGLTVEEFTNLL